MMKFSSNVLTCVAVLAVAPVPLRLSAQAQLPRDATWTLEGNHGGYCITFLADPEIAKRMIPGNTVLRPAGSGKDLPVLLTATIKEEPRFAEWIPGSICFGFYRRVMSADKVIATGKGDHPVIIATVSLAATTARGVEGASHVLLDLLTDNRSVASAADRIGVDMNEVKYLTRVRVEGGDPAVTVSIDGTVISFSGHAVADSSVGKTRSVSFGYGGPKSANWLMTLKSVDAANRLIVGNLSVDGRNNLAKALLASPARAIGPQESGGSVTIEFHAVTKK